MPVHRLHSTVRPGEPETLNRFLAHFLPAQCRALGLPEECPMSKLRRLIISGSVFVNGRRLRIPSAALNRGDRIEVTLDPDLFFREKQPDDILFELRPQDILYEDEDLIAVNKPARLPTEATIVEGRDNLAAAVKRYLLTRTASEPYLGLHHRLDRDTSGVILFTKRKEANAAVHRVFEEHLAQKEYIALCISGGAGVQVAHDGTAPGAGVQVAHGGTAPGAGVQVAHDGTAPGAGVQLAHGGTAPGAAAAFIRTPRPKADAGQLKPGSRFTVENSLGRISPKSQAARWGAVETGGQPARTDFEVLEQKKGMLVIQARPLTGRTHQIRVHLAGRGLPLLGDPLYGGAAEHDGKPVPRVMLHARSLTIPHPADGHTLCIEAPFPPDWLVS